MAKAVLVARIKSNAGKRTLGKIPVDAAAVDELREVFNKLDSVDVEPGDGEIDVRVSARIGIVRLSGVLELDLVEVEE